MKKTLLCVILSLILLTSCQIKDYDGATPSTAPPTVNTGLTNVNEEEESVPAIARITPEPTPDPATPSPEPTSTPRPAPTPYTPPVIENVPEGIINPFNTRFGSPYNEDGSLKNDREGWWFKRNKDFQPPSAQTNFDIRQFNGYYLGDITQPIIYLTFDEGYEYGFTPQILDTLKEKGITVAFFVTKPFIQSHPELCIRMVEEGHIVGNHTVSHKNSHELSDEAFIYELTETARYFKEATGYNMDPYFRFPAGEYSARVISLANDLGYKSIFWSMAYEDWNVNNQPGKQAAYNHVTSYYHNGCIILLHAVSESNTQALGDIIDFLLEKGYVFKTLDELPVY